MSEELDVYVDFAVLNFDWISLQFLIGMLYSRSCLRIILPSVPRADDLAIFNHALSEGAALVKAFVVHRGDLSPGVHHANHFSIAGKVACFVGGGKMCL